MMGLRGAGFEMSNVRPDPNVHKFDPILNTDPMETHQSHFHIDLRTPSRVALSQNLLADNGDSLKFDGNEEVFLDQIQKILPNDSGEEIMFPINLPDVPPQDQPVFFAQSGNVSQLTKAKEHILGVCHPVPNAIAPEGARVEYVIDPSFSAQYYLSQYEKLNIEGLAVATVLQNPTHGKLMQITAANSASIRPGKYIEGSLNFAYFPEEGYVGNDRAIILVDFGGQKVKVVYFFKSLDHPLGNNGYIDECKKTGNFWKISQDANGNPVLVAMDAAPAVDTATTLLSNEIGAYGDINITFSDLAGGAVGQTTGTLITLDDNAAGHNWFIDTTPGSNEEFLPTSNPYEWVAKQGTAAYGKMDMLSVLLHEYGHALGIEHSADSNDYMAPTLTPGVRRLPTADELALMQQLVGQVKSELTADTSGGNTGPGQLPLMPLGGLGLAFLGRLRSTRYGSLAIEPDYARTV